MHRYDNLILIFPLTNNLDINTHSNMTVLNITNIEVYSNVEYTRSLNV